MRETRRFGVLCNNSELSREVERSIKLKDYTKFLKKRTKPIHFG